MKLWSLLFASFLVLFEAMVAVWWRARMTKRHGEMKDAIRAGLAPAEGIAGPAILVEPPQPKANLLAKLFGQNSDSMDDGSGKPNRPKPLLTLGCALAGILIGTRFTGLIGAAAPIMGGIAGAVIPGMIRAKKLRRHLATLEEQFPEALDCLARSLRAGNAFSVAIQLLSTEINEPLKSEFQKVTREMTLGARLEDALAGLMVRVPLVEVRFFVSAVLLQRETGGNLSEVITKLAGSLRDRFKLRGHVKASSGQGRLTASVLSALPIATVALLAISSPEYLGNLINDPLGRNLLAAAVVLQVIGYIVMKRIIRIEV